jgi:hypothetical protein
MTTVPPLLSRLSLCSLVVGAKACLQGGVVAFVLIRLSHTATRYSGARIDATAQHTTGSGCVRQPDKHGRIIRDPAGSHALMSNPLGGVPD